MRVEGVRRECEECEGCEGGRGERMICIYLVFANWSDTRESLNMVVNGNRLSIQLF